LRPPALEIENDVVGKRCLAKYGPNRRLRNVEDDGLIDRLDPSKASRVGVIKKTAG
jgi:hypothetical protein